MECPTCGALNDPSFRFCLKCGTPLAAVQPPGAPSTLPVQPPPVPPGAQTAIYPPPPGQGQPAQGGFQPVPQAPAMYPPPAVTGAPPGQPPVQAMAGRQAAGAYPPPPVNAYPPQAYPVQPSYAQPASAQAASYGMPSKVVMSIWGPFAGFGRRFTHKGWLLDNQGKRAPDLQQKVNQKFQERSVPGALLSNENLVDKGVVVEQRPYFILRRGLVSVCLYINEFGKDLFISMASYLKPPLSFVRILLLGGMVFFWLAMTIYFPLWYGNAIERMLSGLTGGLFGLGGGISTGSLTMMVCVLGPLNTINTIALLLFVLYSLYKFFAEKDILAGLRRAPNEFNRDDLMAMELAVEQTVRLSMDEIGLKSDELKPVNIPGSRMII